MLPSSIRGAVIKSRYLRSMSASTSIFDRCSFLPKRSPMPFARRPPQGYHQTSSFHKDSDSDQQKSGPDSSDEKKEEDTFFKMYAAVFVIFVGYWQMRDDDSDSHRRSRRRESEPHRISVTESQA